MSNTEARGLAGVVVGDSAICFIDGEKGELVYRGYAIEELAGRASFEEVAHLLWVGELPARAALAELGTALLAAARLPPGVLEHLRILPRTARPIDVVRTLASLLGSYDRDAETAAPEAQLPKAIRLTGALSAGVAAYQRIRSRLPVLEPRSDLGHAANFLWMMTGELPDRHAVRAFDAALVLHMEHDLNASTFAARVTASTLADLYASVTAAAGALKGPLHGGANERVMEMLEAVGKPARAAEYVRERLAGKHKIMGFGHRVYRTEDPRATVLRGLSDEACRARDQSGLFATARAIEEAVAATLGGKGIAPNVDFYSASLYHALGIPLDLFTPIFAIARVVGWTSHIMEQYTDNRLIRPRTRYSGSSGRRLRPLAEREEQPPAGG